MRYIIILLSLLLVIVSSNVIKADSRLVQSIKAPACIKIAYVIDSKDKNFEPGQSICRGQIIPMSSQVVIGCIHANNRFLVKNMFQLKECETDLAFPNSSSEDRARGDDNKFVLLSPKGRYLIQNNIPLLSWLPMNGAKKYIVKTVGNNSRSEYETKSNSVSITLPSNISNLTVIVQAYSDIRRLSSEIYTFTVLPESSKNIVERYLDIIDQFSIPEKDKGKLKLSVLEEYNLINNKNMNRKYIP